MSDEGAGPQGGGDEAAVLRPTEPQRRYLLRGLAQPGGKLPLHDGAGRAVAARTVLACLANGWAEPWFANPLKPDWLVCRLTARGREAVGEPAPAGPAKASAKGGTGRSPDGERRRDAP